MISTPSFNPTRCALDLVSLLLIPIVAIATGCTDPATTTDTRTDTPTTATTDQAVLEAVARAMEDARMKELLGKAKAERPITTPTTATTPTATTTSTPTTTTTATATATEATGPQLTTMAVGSGVENRAIVGEADNFLDGTGKVFCWSDLSNADEPSTVNHIWRYGDREIARHTLNVGKSRRFRTWSYQRMSSRRQGTWSCEVVGPDGARLGMTEFTVTGSLVADAS